MCVVVFDDVISGLGLAGDFPFVGCGMRIA